MSLNNNNKDTNCVPEVSNDKIVKKSTRSSFIKMKDPFYSVNDKYRTTCGKQIILDLNVKRAVFERSLKDVKGITRNDYLCALRNLIFNRLLSNFKFLQDCLNLGLNPFVAAQNIAMAGIKQIDKVLNSGVESVYKNDMDALEDAIFSEQELAMAKFGSLTNNVSDAQLNEAKHLIEAMKQVLKLVGKQD
mgnify:CR=1 FL=1